MLYLVFYLILIVGLACFAAVFRLAFKRAYGPYLKSKRRPVVTSSAVVAGKNERKMPDFSGVWEHRLGRALDPSEAVREEPTDWFAAFECEDGTTREFAVSRTIYEVLIIGDRGTLAWQGDLFVRFSLPGDETEEQKPLHHDWL